MQKTVMIALLAAAAAGCSKSEPDKSAAAPATEPPAAAKPAEPAAKPAQPAPAEPMRKDITPTAQDKLGTVPDGYSVAVGDKLPAATVQNLSGEPVELSSLIAERPILLVFYRGGWCPYCNSQIYAMTQAYPEFDKRGVTPVFISVDGTEEAGKTNASYDIPFPVLSDPDLAAHEALHVVNALSDEDVARLAGFGLDLQKYSGRDHHKIGVPSMFLVDTKGVIRWRHVEPEYTIRPTTDQLLAVLDANGFGPK